MILLNRLPARLACLKNADFKQAGILAGWLAALIAVSGLLWFFTGSLRDSALITAANRVLEAHEPHIRLDQAIDSQELSGTAARLGVWFSVKDSPDRVVIIPLMREGMQLSFLGVVNPQGECVLHPLGANARRMAVRLPPALLALYTRRIEEHAGVFPTQTEVP